MAVLWFLIKCILWLLAVVFGLLVFALLVPITAELCYEKGQFTAAVRVLLLRVRVYPWPEKEKKQNGLFAKWKAKREERKQEKQQPVKSPVQNQPAESPQPQTEEEKSIESESKNMDEPEKAQTEQGEQTAETQAAEKRQVSKEPTKKVVLTAKKKTQTKTKPKPEGKDALLNSLDKIKALVCVAGAVMRRVLAALRIHHIRIVLPVHIDDAAQTAVAVGGVHAALHSSLGVLNNVFTLQFKQLTIIPDYHNEYEGQEHFSCKITTHLIIMVVIAIWAFFRLKEEKIIG